MRSQRSLGWLAGVFLLFSWGGLIAGGPQGGKSGSRTKTAEAKTAAAKVSGANAAPKPKPPLAPRISSVVALRSVSTEELRTRTAAGDLSAATALGARLLAGEGEPLDGKGLDILVAAGDKGSVEARGQWALSLIDLMGRGLIAKITDAQRKLIFSRLTEASEAGWPDATFELGRLTVEGMSELNEEPGGKRRGWQLIHDAEVQGSGRAATYIGTFKTSRAESNDIKDLTFPELSAETLLQRGLERGDLSAYRALGLACLKSNAPGGDSLERALAWWERGASHGRPSLALELSTLYTDGGAVTPDPAKAKAWATLAAQNHVPGADQQLEALAAKERAAAKREECQQRRRNLEAKKARLQSIEDELDRLKKRMSAIETTVIILQGVMNANPNRDYQAEQDLQNYNREYNAKVKAYNDLVERHRDLSDTFEQEVESFNADCASGS